MSYPTLEPGDLLTTNEVAERLSVHYLSVVRMIAAGNLKAHKVGTQWRIHRDDLAAYVFGENDKAAKADR